MSRGGPVTRPAPQSALVRGPSINQLWKAACADTGVEPGDGTEATQARYRELLQLSAVVEEFEAATGG